MKRAVFVGGIIVFSGLVGAIVLWASVFFDNDNGYINETTYDLKKYESIVTNLSESVSLPEGYNLYVNGRLNFSVQYPTFYIPNEVKETAISTSVLFSPAGGGTGAQIYVVYYPKDKIDDERFAMDVPSGVRERIAATTLGGVEAVSFESTHTGLGKAYEVWALHGGYLYELTVPYTDKKILDDMVASWQFLR
jgi:hypothetical protein